MSEIRQMCLDVRSFISFFFPNTQYYFICLRKFHIVNLLLYKSNSNTKRIKKKKNRCSL